VMVRLCFNAGQKDPPPLPPAWVGRFGFRLHSIAGGETVIDAVSGDTGVIASLVDFDCLVW